jgi:outer membrane protein TolC
MSPPPRRLARLAAGRLLLAAILAATALATTTPALGAPATTASARIALVIDGTGADSTLLPPLLRQEIARVLQADLEVTILPDDRFRGDETVAGVTAALDRALAAPGVDLVVCTGVLGSLVATGRRDLPVPVIAAVALDAEVQDLPLTDQGTSGVANLTYVLATRLLGQDVGALLDVAGPRDSLALLGSHALLAALPGVAAGDTHALPRDTRGVVVDGGRTAAAALENLPDGRDGVMLLGLAGYPDAEIDALLDGLIARGLPTVAVVGESLVRRGALVGTTSAGFLQKVARRVALGARKILTGADAADLPVLVSREGMLFINLDTARALGVHPPFAVTVDAVLIESGRETGRRLDLWRVMDQAMAANQDLAAAAARLEADREELALARARLLPQIDLSATGALLDQDRAALSGRPAERSLTAGVTASQVLFSDDAWAGYTVARRVFAQREAEYEQQRLDVALRAASAYFEVLRAKTREDLQQSNLRLSRENLERARVRVRLGEASRAEEFRWQAKIAREKADLIAAIAARNVAEMELNRVLSRPLEEPFVLAEPDLDSQLSLLLDDRLARHLADAWHLRRLREYGAHHAREVAPELQQLRAALAAQRRVLSNTRRSFFLPEVVLSGGVTRHLDEGGAGAGSAAAAGLDDTDWNAALSLSLPLFQGARRFAETRQAGRDLVSLRAQLAAAGERIEQRVRNAVHRTSASRAGIALSREAAAASRRNLDLVRDAYSQGAVDLITLLDAQNALLNAELAAADAVFGFLLDLMELERSVGRFTCFATPEDRSAWLDDLEAWFSRQPDRQERR